MTEVKIFDLFLKVTVFSSCFQFQSICFFPEVATTVILKRIYLLTAQLMILTLQESCPTRPTVVGTCWDIVTSCLERLTPSMCVLFLL